MSFRSLLVHARPEPAELGRLSCAAALADDLGAVVIGLGAETIAPIDPGPGGAYVAIEGQLIGALREQRAANMAAAKAQFDKIVKTRPSEWRIREQQPTTAVAEEARSADLILVGGGERSGMADPYRDVDAGRLILTAGRPVLSCPPGQDHLRLRSVLVAWKDRREARRALADALPLLHLAKEVIVLEVCGPGELDDAAVRTADVVSALGRHGIVTEARTAPRMGSTSDTLIDHADAQGADLIVSGAYGRTRLGEWIFGGVTRTLLRQERRFVLFSH